MEYLVPLVVFLAIAAAIHWFTKPRPEVNPSQRAKVRRWAFVVLGVVLALWLLSALGVCPGIDGITPTDPLLNR